MKASDLNGWLVVAARTVVARPPAGHLTQAAVEKRYGGFDGEVWPVEMDESRLRSGVLTSFSAARKYYQELTGVANVRLLFLSADVRSEAEGVRLRSLGFDFGNYISEFNYFSCILNDIIYGVHPRLNHYVTSLNESLLFPSLDDVQRFADERKRGVASGLSLEAEEAGEEFEPIAISVPVAMLA